MKQLFKIDENGFYIEPVILQNNEEPPAYTIEEPILNGFYSPKWNGVEWVEGLTQTEINTKLNAPKPLSETELLQEQIATMQGALDFIIMNY